MLLYSVYRGYSGNKLCNASKIVLLLCYLIENQQLNTILTMKILRIYTIDGIQLVDYEINGHFNTMPYVYFKSKYEVK